jgi:bifunctional DNA-binding transcriptional regulator/antitoxin component of YhaV-PrlF toxin-antitoxin module
MKRKVNRVGQNTLTVSLPVDWVKKFGIKAGDSIELAESGATLVLAKENMPTEREIEIKLEQDSDRYVRSYIGRLYRNGYSKITVTYEHPDCLTHIKNAVNNLIGADIIDTEINKCTIRVFPVEEMALNFDKQLVKMLITLKTIFCLMKQDLDKGKLESLGIVDELRHNNWKLRDFILRSAQMKCVAYETLTNLACMTFCYEKIGSRVAGFYKRYKPKSKRLANPRSLCALIDRISSFIDWLLSRVSKDEALPVKDETKFREEILAFNVKLLNELHSDKTADHASLTILYMTAELLDSTVSYLSAYERE